MDTPQGHPALESVMLLIVADFGTKSATGNAPSTNINLILAKEPHSLSGQRPGPLGKSPN